MADRRKFVDLSRYRDVDIKSFVIRETNADDTMDAAGRSLPPDGGEVTNQEFGLEMRIQTISQAIIEVNGKALSGPCLDYRTWNGRTREFVGEAYDYVNGLSQEERDGFKKALAGGADDQPRAIPSAPSSSV